MRKRNLVAISIFVLFYGSFGAFLTLNQERIVYQPFPQDFDTCERLDEAERTNYKGTRMYTHDADGPTAVLYHGNAGSACDRSFYADLFSATGYGYVLVEYAGYSNDPRRPTHALIKQDVRNVIEYLESKNVSPVTVVGESIGTGAASYHASLQEPEKLILISPFTDLHDIARDRFWFYPTALLVDNAYDNQTALQNFDGKVLLIHGREDTLIPYQLGRSLYDELRANKRFVTIEAAGHNDLFNYLETFEVIGTFLADSIDTDTSSDAP